MCLSLHSTALALVEGCYNCTETRLSYECPPRLPFDHKTKLCICMEDLAIKQIVKTSVGKNKL